MTLEVETIRPQGIAKIFQAVSAEVDALVRAAGDHPPIQSLGKDRLSDASSPPAIVWELLGGPVTAARQVGADRNLGTREIAERNERLLIHVWGEDFGATERLMNHFVAACRGGGERPGLTAFTFRAISTDWTESQSASSGLGRLCKLEIEICVPFTAAPLGISQGPHVLTLNTSITHQ